MVFDVARAVNVFGVAGIALELGEDRGVGLAHEIGQHVEPAAVRHAEHKLLDPLLGPNAQDRLERRHQQLGPLDPEPLGAGIAPVEKPLERLRGGQNLQFLFFRRVGQARPRVAVLEPPLNPLPLGEHLDMHVLDTDAPAIDLAQQTDDLAQGRALAPEQIVNENLSVEIGFGKPVGPVVQFRVTGAPLDPERVEIGFEMAAHAIGADQVQGADRSRSLPAESLPGRARRCLKRSPPLRPQGPDSAHAPRSVRCARPSAPPGRRRSRRKTAPSSRRRRPARQESARTIRR